MANEQKINETEREFPKFENKLSELVKKLTDEDLLKLSYEYYAKAVEGLQNAKVIFSSLNQGDIDEQIKNIDDGIEILASDNRDMQFTKALSDEILARNGKEASQGLRARAKSFLARRSLSSLLNKENKKVVIGGGKKFDEAINQEFFAGDISKLSSNIVNMEVIKEREDYVGNKLDEIFEKFKAKTAMPNDIVFAWNSFYDAFQRSLEERRNNLRFNFVKEALDNVIKREKIDDYNTILYLPNGSKFTISKEAPNYSLEAFMKEYMEFKKNKTEKLASLPKIEAKEASMNLEERRQKMRDDNANKKEDIKVSGPAIESNLEQTVEPVLAPISELEPTAEPVSEPKLEEVVSEEKTEIAHEEEKFDLDEFINDCRAKGLNNDEIKMLEDTWCLPLSNDSLEKILKDMADSYLKNKVATEAPAVEPNELSADESADIIDESNLNSEHPAPAVELNQLSADEFADVIDESNLNPGYPALTEEQMKTMSPEEINNYIDAANEAFKSRSR
ncbi:MAG: hypothetical protein IJ093_01690 [Bacilli bacterium]|nr:hypothetical protein [Bacilli bacterium]